MEFDEDQIDASRGQDYTEELNSKFKTKAVKNKGRNTGALFLNNENCAFMKKLQFSASLIPQGSYKSGKKAEDVIRPQSIKETVSIENEEKRVSFELNNNYHYAKKKKKF